MKDDDTYEVRPEYPAELVRSGMRGKYARQFRTGSNVVLFNPDLAGAFPDTKPVNDALRQFLAEHPSSEHSVV